VADGVFVGAKQPLDGGSARVAVEVEVFEDVTVDTEVGPDSGTSFGLNWRRDY
jgi:translocation and assembly module TamB